MTNHHGDIKIELTFYGHLDFGFVRLCKNALGSSV